MLSPPRLALLALGLAGLAGSCDAGVAEHFFLISIDGLRADLLDRAPTPNLDLLARSGVRAVSARTVRPAVTLPAHASMLSGVKPENHGFLFNSYMPGKGSMRRPTLLTAAHALGRHVAAFVGKKKLLQLVPSGAVDHIEHSGYHDSKVMGRAAAYVKKERPNLTFIHLPDVDAAGHAHGWGTPQQLEAVSSADTQIGKLFRAVHAAGILRRSAFMIVADHGGNGTVHGVHHPREFQVEWIAGGLGFHPGLQVEAPVNVLDTWPTIFAAMGLEPPSEVDGRVVSEALFYADRDLGEGEKKVEVGALDASLLPFRERGMEIGARPVPAFAPAAPVAPVLPPLDGDRIGLLPPPGWIEAMAARGAL